MASEARQLSAGGKEDAVPGRLLEPLREFLSGCDETDRYRLFASLLLEAAGHAKSHNNRGGLTAEQAEGLNKKLQQVQEEKAALNDRLASARADLDHRSKQLEAEQSRAGELQRIIDDQRGRLEALQKQLAEIEAQLSARIADCDRAEGEKDRLTLQLQRAEKALADPSKVERLEEKRGELSGQLEKLRSGMERLRADKDAEINRLTGELRKVQASAGQGADELLAVLWERLARAKPPLAEGHVPPTPQSAERMAESLIELVRFADEFDKFMRPFLSKYTRHEASVKVPWEVYAKSEDLHKAVFQTVSPKGTPVALLRMRLNKLKEWVEAATVGCDSAIESIASELQAQLTSSGSDQAKKVKDFIRDDGHYVFLERMRELRSQKLAETFGRGG